MRHLLFRTILLSILTGAAGSTRAAEPFVPTLESLRNYQAPEWFRDAKFGIYVHWGVYSVAEMGEWYAREMYMEDHPVYRYHVETYGHPSEFGYKDLIPLWKAEHFDPNAWLDLFVEAGAKYFTPCAVHHDGFQLWDCAYSHYDAVDMGPKKDLLGMMRAATLKHGIRFGVTTHFGRTLSWIQTSHGSDSRGPKKGVPYDGVDPNYQDLYMLPYYDDNRADTENPPPMWRAYWHRVMTELIDNYSPDFLYLDSAVPFAGEDGGETGFRLFAHFYNACMRRHGGRQEGVLTHKGDKGTKRAPYFSGIATLDIERGKSRTIREAPWQTDDSIGPWGYRRGAEYKDADAVIDKMIDIVSKNGNLLLNIPPKADGTLDDQTQQILRNIGAWFRINGEAIYATRPWAQFGEGPDVDMSSRATRSPYGPKNVRFTRSKDGKVIYAILMGWPGGDTDVSLTSFAQGQPGETFPIESVVLLGSSATITWQRDAAGLHLHTPGQAPSHIAVAFKIE